MPEQTHNTILTRAEAAQIDATRALLDELANRVYMTADRADDLRGVSARGRVAGICDVASDALFAILNHASSYGDCRNADEAIKASRYARAAEREAAAAEPVEA